MQEAPEKKTLYTTTLVLSSVVLYYVQRLSASGRTAVDWAVIGLVVGAVLWNVVQLGRRLYASGALLGLAHLLRTLALWTVGLFNTAFIRAEDAGGWREPVGWAFLLFACADTVALFRRELASISAPGAPASPQGEPPTPPAA